MKNDLIAIIARYNNLEEKEKIKAIETLSHDPESIIYAYSSFDLALMRGTIDKCISLTSIMCALVKKRIQKESLEEYMKKTSNAPLVKAISLSSPKLTKNTARIMGSLKDPVYTPLLISALNKETQQFVRPYIVQAIGAIGEESSIAVLREVYNKIDKNTTEKHKLDEIDALKHALLKNEIVAPITFLGLQSQREIVLRTMPGYAFDLKQQLNKLGYDSKTSNQNDQDVVVTTDKAEALYDIRTFSDLYFIVARKIPLTGKAISVALDKFDIVSFLKETHGVDLSKMYYRIEIPGTSITQKQRGDYIKEITSHINKLPLLEDNPYNYQLEILIEPFSRSCDIYLNLKTIKDTRFNYRKNTLPASINPYIAAIIANYISKYAKPTSTVLDPFCGTGTMLIERARCAPYANLNGVDIKKNAIDFATENSELADAKIEYTLSDILRYSSDTPYDEIISNMPFGNRVGNHIANVEMYDGFFKTVRQYLAEDGILALYTMEGTLLEFKAGKNDFKIIEKHKMYAGGLRPTLYILK